MGAPVAQIYGSFATKNWLVLLERNVAVNASAISDRKIGDGEGGDNHFQL